MARDDARRYSPDADATREPYTRAELRLVCRKALQEIATSPSPAGRTMADEAHDAAGELDRLGHPAEAAEQRQTIARLQDEDELTRRVLATYLEAHCATYGIATILEALADALTVTAREAESEPTGPLAVLVSQIENARAYALLNQL